jgi:hypothetical protein
MGKGIEFIKNLDKIIICAQGPSWYQCPDKVPSNCEIWGSNVIYRDHCVDRLFFGHDARGHFLEDDIHLFENLNALDIPVYTMSLFKPLTKNALVPVMEILEEFNIGFFLTTIAYMVATAIMQKPKCIEFYGVDMRPDAGGETYGNEKGCVEFWVGVAKGRGIIFKNTLESYILKIKQEGSFPNFRPKLPQAGLIFQIPEKDRNMMSLREYIIVPDGIEE